MKLLKQVGKAKDRIFNDLTTWYPVKILGVLALGAIVMAGTGLYLAPNFANEMSAHPSNEDIQISPDDQWMYGQQNYEAALAANLARREDEARATMRRLEAYIAANKSAEGIHVFPEDDSYTDPDLGGPASVIDRLERRIDSMLAEGARDPSKNTPSFYREIERLVDQIEMIRLNAMKDAPQDNTLTEGLTRSTFRTREELRAADRQDDLRDMVQYWNQLKANGSTEGTGRATPSTNVRPSTDHKDQSADNTPNRYEVQIKQLEQRLDAMLAEAARDPSRNTPSFYRQIERLDNQIEMLRLNGMKDASVGMPLSGNPDQMQFDRPNPDTDYYQNPDWRESEAAEE